MADKPNSPGQVEKAVLPTLSPNEASLVIWFLGFEAMIAGTPNLSDSHKACNLLAHWAITEERSLALKIKWRR